ncbi:MAG: sigma 54-interacting transcriptional regulator [Deltaproteobacteria bacterium]|nr:sigma 54-interacting transcriptional regulator [Deltaproteobacteria bacterium]
MSGLNYKKNLLDEISALQILNDISEGVFTVDSNWRITFFNEEAARITGVKIDDALGERCSEVFRSNMCQTNCPVKKAMELKAKVRTENGYIINSSGKTLRTSICASPLMSDKKEIVGGVEIFRDITELDILRQEVEGTLRLSDLETNNPEMKKILSVLPAIAESPSTVLIQGETGTGKEVIARAIHSLSSRSSKPFVAVNCAAIPESLIESELFGHVKGAFTGATHDRTGRFEAAYDGTIFLDEIGELSPAMQIKLLRVLQQRTWEKLGSNAPNELNARIITATNRDLVELMKNGEFREDFYYRINVVKIELIPLRQRVEDIYLLVRRFIKNFNLLHKKNVIEISPGAMELLINHSWPGNIRELENTIERAFVLCNGTRLNESHVSIENFSHAKLKPLKSLNDNMDNAEKTYIISILESTKYNVTEAALTLKMHRSTLYRKIHKYGIDI